MTDIVNMEDREIRKCLAIVRFGPETATGGMRPAEYYQVTIDPDMVSPEGGHIRFGMFKGDEIVGWQKLDAMTVCEVLRETPDAEPMTAEGYTKEKESVIMRCVINKE